MKNFLKCICVLGLLALVLSTVPSCNTTKGAGKDIEKAGDAIKDSADRHGAD